MSKDEKEICLYCRWWGGKPANEKFGLISQGSCQLRAPVLTQWGSYSEGLESSTKWPLTKGGDFCGEFKERDPQN